jgi:hypothetical protein
MKVPGYRIGNVTGMSVSPYTPMSIDMHQSIHEEFELACVQSLLEGDMVNGRVMGPYRVKSNPLSKSVASHFIVAFGSGTMPVRDGLDLSVVPRVVLDGFEYLHASKFCEAVMKFIGKSKAYSSAAITKSAIVALTRRNLEVPVLVSFKGRNYVTRDDAVKLLRGLVLDIEKLIDLIPKIEGLPSAQSLLTTLKEEGMQQKHRATQFANVLGIFPETVRTAVSKQAQDTVIAEIYPILIALGYDHQAAIDYWNSVLLKNIQEKYETQTYDFCTRTSDNKCVVVEYIKFHGASKKTPCVSSDALRHVFSIAAHNTPAGQELLLRAVVHFDKMCRVTPSLADVRHFPRRKKRKFGNHLYIMMVKHRQNVYKVGRTSHTKRRLIELGRTSYPPDEQPEFIHVFENKGMFEKKVHNACTKYRMGTSEFFEIDIQELLSIVNKTVSLVFTQDSVQVVKEDIIHVVTEADNWDKEIKRRRVEQELDQRQLDIDRERTEIEKQKVDVEKQKIEIEKDRAKLELMKTISHGNIGEAEKYIAILKRLKVL